MCSPPSTSFLAKFLSTLFLPSPRYSHPSSFISPCFYVSAGSFSSVLYTVSLFSFFHLLAISINHLSLLCSFSLSLSLPLSLLGMLALYICLSCPCRSALSICSPPSHLCCVFYSPFFLFLSLTHASKMESLSHTYFTHT